ncbi:hypothetical protein [uncultured Desulfovibrio sp.]|uniref:hypothetical protein n=1 Tax=uncultured Desulfovibrio sp. TaxID=167968 RepID=UPI002628CA9C|nr:hypothetical protein [uncultured Desulfovibrio sp.]
MKDLACHFYVTQLQHAYVGKHDISQYPAKYKGALTRKEHTRRLAEERSLGKAFEIPPEARQQRARAFKTGH